MLLDASNIPTVTIPAGAPPWAYALATIAPMVVTGLWVLHKHLERTAKPAEGVATSAELATLRAELGQRFDRLHAAARQIADLQHADSKVLEAVSEKADKHSQALAAVDKIVTLIDRDSFRREPTR